jgi:hypothetical protein
MKKQWRMLIISGCVMAALLLVWIGITVFKPGQTNETTTTASKVPPVFSAAATDIKRVEIHNASADFALYTIQATDKDGKVTVSWKLDTDKNFPLAQDVIDGIGFLATEVVASKEIATGATDLTSYGLVAPAETLTVELNSGEKHVIKFGNEIVDKYYNYAMLDETGRVCTVPSGSVDKVKLTLLSLLDKSKVVDITQTDLTHFIFERARDQARIAIDCQLVGEAGSDSAYMSYKVTEPIKREGSTDSLDTLVKNACGTTAVDFIEIDPLDLAKYGLDKPQYTYTMTTKDKTVTVKLGKIAEGGKYYAISSVFPAVFTVFSSYHETIDLPVIEMLDKMVNLQPIWLVDTIDADLFGTHFTVKINMAKSEKADDADVVFLLDGQNAKITNPKGTSLFSKFYQRLISIQFADLEPNAQPVNNHEGKITFNIKADTENNVPAHTKVIEFTRRDDYTYYVFIDNVYTGFYVNAKDSFTYNDTVRPPDDVNNDDGVIVSYQKLKYAMAHAVDGVFDTSKGYQLS